MRCCAKRMQASILIWTKASLGTRAMWARTQEADRGEYAGGSWLSAAANQPLNSCLLDGLPLLSRPVPAASAGCACPGIFRPCFPLPQNQAEFSNATGEKKPGGNHRRAQSTRPLVGWGSYTGRARRRHGSS
jgi:hypothetical protein